MNTREPIQKWREQPALPAAPPKGWKVIFADDEQGRRPALDYLDGVGDEADPHFVVTDHHLARFSGMVEAIRVGGPAQLRGSDSFVEFVGEDKKSGMCELRIVPKKGHRFLCFQCGEREFLITHAFRKPPQRATPPSEKEAALRILERHLTRASNRPKNPDLKGNHK